MPRIDETLIFPVLIGLAVLFFVAAQVFPPGSRLRRLTTAAFGLLLVGGIVFSILLYLAELTGR